MGGKWLLGIIILAIAAILLSLVGPWNAPKHSEVMGDAVRQAVQSDANSAQVMMEGNVATLTGEASSAAEIENLTQLAANARYPGFEDASATWHEVSNKMTVQKISPYTFNVTKSEDGTVVLNGYVEDQASLDAALSSAKNVFGANVQNDTLKIGPGSPDGNWVNVLTANMSALTGLSKGRLFLEDNQVVVTGETTDAAVRTNINTMMGNLPNGYEGAANITVPEAAIENVGKIRSEKVCQSLLDDLKTGKKINFEFADASIKGAESFDLLNLMASAGEQCSDFRIQVSGHTDNVGEDASNQALSERRANSVVAYLADNGIEVARMSTTGYGESNPIADNTTSEGRAQNRRIEFFVTRSQ